MRQRQEIQELLWPGRGAGFAIGAVARSCGAACDGLAGAAPSQCLCLTIQEEIDAAAFGCFDDDDEDAARAAMARIDDALRQQLQINLSEWLLAEGNIQLKGQAQRLSELLLGPSGPRLEVGQRAWLEQLARRPLRLYDITQVLPGTGITLCDALATDQAPVVVTERAGSRTLKVGMQLGARVIQVADGHQLSGAIYPFSMVGGRAMLDELRALAANPAHMRKTTHWRRAWRSSGAGWGSS
jgi:hypothetical protein